MQEFIHRANLLDAIGGEGENPQFVHIAGTNGKGTTTAFVQSILAAHGHTVGAFFSPYVYDIRERIQLNGAMMSKQEFAAGIAALAQIGEGLNDTEFGGATEFELKTALGFRFWKQQNCDWVALEVGLGGRFDATNVITPATSVIVSIGLDHTAILGDTLGAIAFEKAGIIKPGIPAVIGNVPPEAATVIERKAHVEGAPIWRFGDEVRITESGEIITPKAQYDGIAPTIPGFHILHNCALAIASIEATGQNLDPKLVKEAINATTVPGRFEVREVHGKRFVLDGAHNADSASLLASALAKRYPGQSFSLITGMVEGHDPADLYRSIAPPAKHIYACPINFHRARSPEDLTLSLGELGLAANTMSAPGDAIRAALDDDSDYVVVTGSFYLVGEIGTLLNSAV